MHRFANPARFLRMAKVILPYSSGIAVLSSTILSGQFALRLANVNHRSLPEDFELLLATLLQIGALLS